MPDAPYTWLSLLPSIIAITLALLTRRVILSLLAGVLLGALILADGHPLRAVDVAVIQHLWPSLTDADHLSVFAFTLMMGAMVGVIHQSGGMHGVVDAMSRWARTRRGGQLAVWLLGLVVFFDDYANTLLLGTTMQPLTDRLRISREKLAYIVDSTAAPVAGLALVSTWVAGEIGYIEAGLAGLQFAGPEVNGLQLFVASIPYRFYVLWALLLVGLVAFLRRDFGPMLAAEKRACGAGDPSSLATRRSPLVWGVLKSDVPRRWPNAIVPIAVCISTIIAVLVMTGTDVVAADPELSLSLVNIFGHADSYSSMVYGSLSGLLVAGLLAAAQRILSMVQLLRAAGSGAAWMLTSLAILWMAWTLSGMTGQDQLGTGVYLGGIISRAITPSWLPTIVFLLASAVAFATGTSWGTMALLMPLVIRTTHAVLGGAAAPVSPHDPIFVCCIGGVLAGAIFGDHCSPISDTTVLSSQASGCELAAHVWTQLPYALLAGFVAVVCGTLLVGGGISVWVALPSGTVVLVIAVLLCGRDAERP